MPPFQNLGLKVVPSAKMGGLVLWEGWQVDSSWTKTSKNTSYRGDVIFQTLKTYRKMNGQNEKACPFAWDLLALFFLYRTHALVKNNSAWFFFLLRKFVGSRFGLMVFSALLGSLKSSWASQSDFVTTSATFRRFLGIPFSWS